MQEITIIQPDDWHLHLRDGEGMQSVLADSCRQMARAIVMPNLKPPVTDLAQAQAYQARILAARPQGSDFQPLMTLYLTDKTTPAMIREAKASGIVHGVKLYPAGATTNSDFGVTHIDNAMPALETMAEVGLPLLVHGEVTDPSIDIFDREAVFIETVMLPLLARVPTLRVVFEHITTADAAKFVESTHYDVGATITAHHLLLNRNAIFAGGLRPHHYCLPVLKRETHRQALLGVIQRGSKRFFLGTDSAPHAQHAKESACGCAGLYTANHAIELYTEAFDSVNALDKLEAFASLNGPAFYGLPVNTPKMTLVKAEQPVVASLPFGETVLVPFRAGETVAWQIQSLA